MRYHHTLVRIVIKKSTNNKCWRRCGDKETSYTIGENVNWYSHYGEQYEGSLGFPGGSVVKNPPANAGDVHLIPRLGRSPWRRKWQPTSAFLPGESHGQRSLVGYSPWDCKELATTERLNYHKYSTKITVPLHKYGEALHAFATSCLPNKSQTPLGMSPFPFLDNAANCNKSVFCCSSSGCRETKILFV